MRSVRIINNRQHPPGPRRGYAVVWALACLMLAGVMSTSVLKSLVISQRQLQAEARQLQLDWLADAARGRTRARLQREPQAASEVWTIPAAELQGTDNARIAIEIDQATGDEQARLIHVTVTYPGSETAAPQRRQHWRWDGKTLTSVPAPSAVTHNPQ